VVQGLRQHAVEPLRGRLAAVFDTDRHRLLPCGRLLAIVRVEAIPLKPKLLLVSGARIEWWTRCISGVITIRRSSAAGMRVSLC
jgi:hypothetical protein